MIAVVTNIDTDHLSSYKGDFQQLQATFVKFLHHLPFYGLAVMCVDDTQVRHILSDVARPIITYGIEQPADVRAIDVSYAGTQSHFCVRLPQRRKPLDVTLNIPGQHNVLNALAAIAVGLELNVTDEAMQHALKAFEGIARRFQTYGEINSMVGNIQLVDDYGHHPTEIQATLHAVRKVWPGRRLVLAFQPHRYTRTRDLLDDFAQALNQADVLVLLEVYAANEAPIGGADGRALSRAVRARGKLEPVFVETLDDLPTVLIDVLHDGDVLVTLGAGSIGTCISTLVERLSANGAGS